MSRHSACPRSIKMHLLLNTSTASRATGVPPQRKLFRLDYGPYAGRLVCLYHVSSSEIAMSWAEPPYVNWTTPVNIIDDSADYPCSACIDGDGNIYVVYVELSSLDLIYFKLAFTAGVWATGSPVTILSSESAYYPVIERSADGELCCAFAYYDSGQGTYTINIKTSDDEGATWGSGPTDIGTQLSDPSAAMPFVSLVFTGSILNAIYSQDRSNLYLQRRDSDGENWQSSVLLLQSDYIDSDFACAISSDLKLGIAICPSDANAAYFREFDGVGLSGLQEIVTEKARAPQISYAGIHPCILFAQDSGNGYFRPRYGYKDSDTFIVGNLLGGINYFDAVLLFNEASGTFEDKTAAATETDPADVYHSSSGSLISSAGDILYLGGESRFNCAAILLSTSGAGGTVIWEYFDGEQWQPFTPYSGSYHFNAADKLVYFWKDIESSPAGWQSNAVNSIKKFWVRARVESAFSIAPIGSQLMAIPKFGQLAVARGAR